MSMKLGVVGSRSITDRHLVEETLYHSSWTPDSSMERWDNVMLISGGADGVDTSAELIAEEHNINITVIEPDYSKWGEEHPAKQRNTEIVEKSDTIIAVWDGHSNGTRDTIDKALDRGVPIHVEVYSE